MSEFADGFKPTDNGFSQTRHGQSPFYLAVAREFEQHGDAREGCEPRRGRVVGRLGQDLRRRTDPIWANLRSDKDEGASNR